MVFIFHNYPLELFMFKIRNYTSNWYNKSSEIVEKFIKNHDKLYPYLAELGVVFSHPLGLTVTLLSCLLKVFFYEDKVGPNTFHSTWILTWPDSSSGHGILFLLIFFLSEKIFRYNHIATCVSKLVRSEWDIYSSWKNCGPSSPNSD